ncbi:MAG: hypothetical protein CBC12_05520 [Candidatus Puniceispirillum sp. TMED52]|nr:MAG: hypothetical protein CBC12_05520 [Candidatus Puniceispirillum sp. TMED52]
MTEELNEKFSPKQIKQAIGIASDKRYAGGNMTGATKTIEKLARGLSDHPQVRAVLKRQNEDVNEKFDPADFDLVATDKDKAGAKMNIIMQLRKASDVKGNMPIQFADGKKAKLPPKVIELALKKFASFRKPDAKEKLQTAMGKSYKDMVHALKTMREEVELDEGVDKAKIQKQIDQAEKYLKTFFGNTSSVKMKKVAIQRKIDKLKKQLNEAEERSLLLQKQLHLFEPEINDEAVNEEVQQDLQEAPNYKLYHNTFSGAVQEAIAVAKKKGFDINEDDWHDKVATGPRKPSKDKTNSYSIKLMKNGKPVRQMLQIQVYNMGAKYELNTYVQ